jgi:peptidoglycan-associated lipoprotein
MAGVLVGALMVSACGQKQPPVPKPPPPPPSSVSSTNSIPPPPPPSPPEPVAEPIPVPPEPVRDPTILSASLDDLNRNSPLKPVFFEYDSAEITPQGQAILQENATTLKGNATWTVTIEGHCDERGTAEYNLALGERRAVAARVVLISLGIPAERLRTVSYGKEFPFDTGRDEAAMAKNRRAHFVITAR